MNMLDVELFMIADTLMAAFLALGFLGAYLFDRKLSVFRWWSGFYALVTVPIGTTALRFEPHDTWIEVASWGSLFTAAALAAVGMYRESDNSIRPHRAIFVTGLLFVAICTALGLSGAAADDWAIWGVAPTVVFAFWMILRYMTRHSAEFMDFVYAGVLLAGTALIAARSLWFVGLYHGVQNGEPFPIHGEVQALVIFLATILAMGGHAVALTLRVALRTVGEIREHSSRDALSGLLNRGTFDEMSISVDRIGGSSLLSVAVFDIDHFKQVNDTAGHPAGDKVIAALGSILLEACSDHHIAGRIGGEEFAVILPNSNLTAARLFAEAVRTRFAACDFGEEVPWQITLSGGISERRGDEPMHALIARADRALYAAKSGGRNMIVAEPITLIDSKTVKSG